MSGVKDLIQLKIKWNWMNEWMKFHLTHDVYYYVKDCMLGSSFILLQKSKIKRLQISVVSKCVRF